MHVGVQAGTQVSEAKFLTTVHLQMQSQTTSI